MAINERLIHTASDSTSGSGNQEEGLILHLDANDVDSYDGDGSVWYDITNHEYTPAVDPAENFNTVTFTSTGVTNASVEVTGVGFQPDLVWIKGRNYAHYHRLTDSVRGVDKALRADTTDAEQSSDYFSATSFNEDGFNYRDYQESDETLVAWCFKAGGTAVSNTDGSTTSQVSVNNDLGFSIVKTSSTSGAITFGHGLDSAPEMIINKGLTSTGWSWLVYHKDIGTGKYLRLNDTSSTTTNAGSFSSVTSTTITNSSSNSSSDYINYCFTSKRGVSKVGSYTGNSGTKEIYLGFQPAWVMIKRANTGNQSWAIMDNQRDGSLFANSTLVESGAHSNDFTAQGFTINGSSLTFNNSGDTYIYLAFAAKKPDSLIDDTDLKLHLDAGNTDSYDPSSDGSTWSDLTSGNHDATLTSMNADQHDKEIGGWFTFDGSADYGEISDVGVDTNTVSLELWARPHNITDQYQYIAMLGSAAATAGKVVSVSMNYGKLYSYDGNNFPLTATVLTANKWHHIVVTRSGTSRKIYVDGENVLTDTTATTYSGDDSLDIGRYGWNSGSSYFDGDIGQLRIYSSELTADEVMQNYRFTKNNYPNGINGTLVGPSWNPSGYFDFNGTSDYVTFNYSKWHDNFTVSFWVYFDDLTLGKLFDKTTWYASSHQAFPFAISANNGTVTASISYGNDYSFDVNVSGSYTTGKWYHILVTAEHGDKLKIWSTAEDGTFNTTPSGEAAYTGTVNGSGNNNYTIGRASTVYGGGVGQDSFLDGRISKLKMFDKVLSESERSAQFNEGA